MKKIKIILAFCLLSVVFDSAMADFARADNTKYIDIENMDISGIKLGDNVESSIDKMPCNQLKKEYNTPSGEILTNYLNRCGDLEFVINANSEKKIYEIFRTINFSVRPNFEEIREQIYAKYGKPHYSGKTESGPLSDDSGYIVTMCWGGCNKEVKEDTGYGKGSTVYGSSGTKYLLINFVSFDKYDEKYDTHDNAQDGKTYYMSLQLYDTIEMERNTKNAEQREKKLTTEKENRARNKERNLNL